MLCVKKTDTFAVVTKPFDPDESLTCNNITPTHLIHKAGCSLKRGNPTSAISPLAQKIETVYTIALVKFGNIS
jgi:hypothetical protein